MNNYDFSTLNDKEFEQLSKDLLNGKFNLNLQDFKVGRDKGVDLRYSTPTNNNSIVVQAKHYVRSQYAQLKHIMKNEELAKVEYLKPDRYILTTSLSLSAYEKDKIKDILFPFVLTSNDIFSREDLNGFLDDLKAIEVKYFKLWFSSINIFNAILNNAIEGRSKYLLEKIQKNISLYVITTKLNEAHNILTKEKLLLITGQPGIGKTTLAEIIILNWAKNNHKILKVENIKEAEDIISPNEDEKQLFFFDDFLGANYIEIINAHRTETQLTQFLERVRSTPNKFLVLTTRTVILNQAIEKFEKISHAKLENRQFELKLNDYSKYEKAQILYNHLYFKGVKEELFDSILSRKFYFEILNHVNFTPRIIEFMTNNSIINSFSADEYHQYILNNLDNPKDIWRYSFNNQIDYMDRCFLTTLFTFNGSVMENDIRKSFSFRQVYEKTEHNQIINVNQFNYTVSTLLNGFISTQIFDIQQNNRVHDFINPSLFDFLLGYISDSFEERRSIISSITYFEQLTMFDPAKKLIPLEKELQLIIRDKISMDKLEVMDMSLFNTWNKKNTLILEILCRYCRQVNTDNLLLKHFEYINFDTNLHDIFDQLLFTLNNIEGSPLTMKYVSDNFLIIIDNLIKEIDDVAIANSLPQLFEKFNQNFEEYCKSSKGFDRLVSLIEYLLRINETDLINERNHTITSFEEVEELYYELTYIQIDLTTTLFPNLTIDYDFGITFQLDDWRDRIQENALIIEQSLESKKYSELYPEPNFEMQSEDLAIEDLFTKQI